ncbi:hypothetical protein HNR65_002574 [Desulfosalsimonas propionicica]|uniref:Uncharacterized protein n=1 Tax=Desulfosalsimonas propionicica TaxID=332175 RepID=A0A7W0CAM6_9BACT|nr:hypothetical protein [Desulfosalsimonas propionicica]
MLKSTYPLAEQRPVVAYAVKMRRLPINGGNFICIILF